MTPPSPPMDLTAIRKLVRLMQQAELNELEIDDSNQGFRVHLKRGAPEGPAGSPVVMMPQMMGQPGGPVPMHPASHAGPETGAGAPAAGSAPPAVDGETINSPMVGTFYRAASPDAEPFTEVGSVIDDESVLCIIEAMKVMNEIKSEVRGTIVDVLVQNGEPVEFGQPLFVVKKS